jgi:hypothetical protein
MALDPELQALVDNQTIRHISSDGGIHEYVIDAFRHRQMTGSSPWLKSRAPVRRVFGPGSRRRDEAVLAEIRASLDNEEPGARIRKRRPRDFKHGLPGVAGDGVYADD